MAETNAGVTSEGEGAPAGEMLVGIVMGSRSDWETMQHAAAKLDALGVPHEIRVVSAHRTPDVLFDYAEKASERGLRAIIAGAGGAAHLPGMLAAKTAVPVPVSYTHLSTTNARHSLRAKLELYGFCLLYTSRCV